MTVFQELGHGPSRDYQATSPHLKHRRLYDRLLSLVLDEFRETSASGLPLTVLEIGAGDGSYTEPALAYGCSVTATEMSRPSLARLRERFGSNPRFSAVFDPDGSLDVLGGQRFSVVLCSSVLHHIPDYLGLLDVVLMKHLSSGGSLIAVQDPLWYPSLSKADLYLGRLAYLSWRLTRKGYAQGARTLIRRVRGVVDESNPSDMVEYHVVRSGVDQKGISALLAGRFETVRVLRYWSTQAALWQRIGESLGRANTFAVVARNFRG